jgi:ATP-binding cassette subfamily F protein uup
MPPLLSCQSVSKSYRSRPLFREITLIIDEGERLGLIGPNGSGKSTLLKILAGQVTPDDGGVTARKGLRIAYVPQDESFAPEKTVTQIVIDALPPETDEHMRDAEAAIMITKMEFPSGDQLAGQLSGGWRKRLSIACQLVKNPDLLLLDEPTNHLDLEGVLWLENLLNDAKFAFILVTHDRTFLENVCERIVELNASYAEGYLSVQGGYSDFLEQRDQYMRAQAHLQQAMESRLRREIAWLQRGARARQKKSTGRIREANKLIDDHAEVKFRNNQNISIDVDFSATGRKTKELLVAKGIEKTIGTRKLFSGLEFALRPGTKLGLMGPNGSGKTTLLRILAGELQPDKGTIKRADQLRVVMFDQNREQLDQTKSLKESLCPSGDAVVFRDRSLHVATWARKFLFNSDQLNMPISYLSGGEQARILIANLMLQPADLLILDEPTNDLDIPSLEVLEESLEDFPGAVVLVTHDRYLLDNVSNAILELKPPVEEKAASERKEPAPAAVSAPKRKGLSTNEKKELEQMPQKIEKAEQEVATVEAQLSDQEISSNHVRLQEIMKEVEAAKSKVEALYTRWDDLEQRSKES